MNDFSMGMTLLAAADNVAVTTKEAPVIDVGIRLLVLVALCVIPYVLGALLARTLRLKEFSNRIGTVLLSFTFGLAPFVFAMINAGEVSGWKNAMRLGIDLAGGTNLIYQVETKEAIAENKNIESAMNQLVQTIQKRINPSGTEEVAVRRVGTDRIEVIIPGADQGVVAEKKRRMVQLGSLEFGIVANSRNHSSIIKQALAQPKTKDTVSDGNRVVAVWRTVSSKGEIPSSGTATVATRTVQRKDPKLGKDVPATQVLIIQEKEDDVVTGRYLTRATVGLSETGSAAVNFSFNGEGASRFFRLTNSNRPSNDGHKRQLAILLDGQLHSAPNINSTISDNGQITGNFSQQELQALVGVLTAGALDLPINPEPIAEFSISPLLGVDVQRKGMLSIWLSSLGVFIFMLVYYRFSGIIADLSLILNLVLILGSMAICNATFTLPGLAGMVLTIGMAVDTNVLIYERMREEMARGSSLKMTIFNGFDKALSAIVDSNITTLIAAVVLYMIGTDQIKGFAVSLFIGITMSMFSALYFGHLMFDIAERKRWVKELKMGKLIGVPKYDFIAKMKTAVTFSVSFIVFGLVLLFARGTESLDIDFSGGSMITFQFKEAQQIDDVRNKLSATFSNSMSLERLALSDESAAAESGKQFRLRTKEQDVNKIRDGISQTFSNDAKYELKRVTLDFTPLSKPVEPKAVSKNDTTTTVGNIVLKDLSDRLPTAQGDDEVKGVPAKDEEKKSEEKSEQPITNEKKSKEKESDAEDTKKDAKPAVTESKETDKPESTPEKQAETTTAEKEEPTKDKEPVSKTKSDAPTKTKPVTEILDESDSINPDSDDNFTGGLRSELSFSSEITTSTATSYLMAELQKVNKSYVEPEALFRMTGLEGSGTSAKEGKVRNYSKMLLEVRSTVPSADLETALATMKKTMATTPIFEEVSNFASSVAEDMRYMAILALLASGAATIIYLWFRFTKADFGVAAVVAVFHDVLFVLACLPMAYYLSKIPTLGPLLALDDFKLNLSVVAAFLTIIGYSLNDTIVIFDRVREIRGRNPNLTAQMVNDSVNQTLSRTILTATTVFIVVAILYFVGGEGIHGFAFCMLVGTLVGTYSTVFIASPFLLWMMNREQNQARSLANRK